MCLESLLIRDKTYSKFIFKFKQRERESEKERERMYSTKCMCICMCFPLLLGTKIDMKRIRQSREIPQRE